MIICWLKYGYLLVAAITVLLDSQYASANVLESQFINNIIADNSIQTELSIREAAALRLKTHLEAAILNNADTIMDQCNSTNKLSQSACGSRLQGGVCSPNFGDTEGCGCSGRMLSTNAPVVMVQDADTVLHSSEAANQVRENFATSCIAHSMSTVFQNEYVDFMENGNVKWLYIGLENGNLMNFPGFLWPRDYTQHGCNASSIGDVYDPRYRPWHLSASTGPKNVIFILDTSGSMSINGRLELLKKSVIKAINGLTHNDYVSLITFDNTAETFLGLKTLAQAMPEFRSRLISYVTNLQASGGTNFNAAFTKAFEVVDHSQLYNYTSGCQTAFIFLTDGQATLPQSLVQSRLLRFQTSQLAAINSNLGVDRSQNEYYFIAGMGAGVNEAELNKLTCLTKGSYHHVSDFNDSSLEKALFAFRKLFSYHRSRNKEEGVVWSERYVSIPNIFGFTATASVPIYNKTDPNNWKLVGVAAADSATCKMETAIRTGLAAYTSTSYYTKRGCVCESNWAYNGQRYEGANVCTKTDWTVPWCAVNGLTCPQAICNVNSVSTGCWDDCSPYDRATIMNEILYKRSDQTCAATVSNLSDLNSRNVDDACFMDQLSDDSTNPVDRCVSVGYAGQCSMAGSEALSRISTALSPQTLTGTPTITQTQTTYNFAEVMERLVGPLGQFLTGQYNDDLNVCTCQNQNPTCICASRVEAAEYEAELALADKIIKSKGDDKEHADLVRIIVGSIIGGISMIGLIFGIIRCKRQSKANMRGMEMSMQTNSLPVPPPAYNGFNTGPSQYGVVQQPQPAPGGGYPYANNPHMVQQTVPYPIPGYGQPPATQYGMNPQSQHAQPVPAPTAAPAVGFPVVPAQSTNPSSSNAAVQQKDSNFPTI